MYKFSFTAPYSRKTIAMVLLFTLPLPYDPAMVFDGLWRYCCRDPIRANRFVKKLYFAKGRIWVFSSSFFVPPLHVHSRLRNLPLGVNVCVCACDRILNTLIKLWLTTWTGRLFQSDAPSMRNETKKTASFSANDVQSVGFFVLFSLVVKGKSLLALVCLFCNETFALR